MSPLEISHPPYVGVTGFMLASEVSQVLELFEDKDCTALLMAGVLVSDYTLDGKTGKSPWIFPKREDIKDIFVDHPRILNLLHFHTHDQNELLAQLRSGIQWGGANCHGFQLNVVWPDPEVLRQLRSEYPQIVIVLQVGSKAFEEVSQDMRRLCQKLSLEYKDLIDYVLFDMSGGVGVKLSPDLCKEFISYITGVHLERYFGIGVAGGLDGIEVFDMQELFDAYRQLCVDAQSGLRDRNKELDVLAARIYVSNYISNYHLTSFS